MDPRVPERRQSRRQRRSSGGDWRGRKIIDAILDDPRVGVLICPVIGPFPPERQARAGPRGRGGAHGQTGVRGLGVAVGTEPAYRETLLGSSRVATFRTVANCLTAVRAHLDHHRFVRDYRSPFDAAPRTASPSFRKAQALMRPGQQLSEHAAKQLLRAYGIRVPREQLVTSARRPCAPRPRRLPGRDEGVRGTDRPQDRTRPGEDRTHLRKPGQGRLPGTHRHRALRRGRTRRRPRVPDGGARCRDGSASARPALRADGHGRPRRWLVEVCGTLPFGCALR